MKVVRCTAAICALTGCAVAMPPAAQAESAVPAVATTLAAKYPGDVGIGSDPAVVLYENFAEGNVAALVAHYSSYRNAGGMTLVADHPPDSPGRQAIRFTSGGLNPTTYLYKSFGSGYDELYFRYYVKYLGNGPWHHAGLWLGGYNPPLDFPYPRAGLRPGGNDLYLIGLEPMPGFIYMDLYVYWMGMHSWKPTPAGAPGDYWGNTLLHRADFRLERDRWVCYELHLKLNSDLTSGGGALLEVWRNDALVRRFDDSGPLGFWIRDKFCPSDADTRECTRYRPSNPTLAPLEQRWRSTNALKINYFWPANYNDAATDASLLFDDMIVATQRIGCTVKR